LHDAEENDDHFASSSLFRLPGCTEDDEYDDEEGPVSPAIDISLGNRCVGADPSYVGTVWACGGMQLGVEVALVLARHQERYHLITGLWERIGLWEQITPPQQERYHCVISLWERIPLW
jgi:hypothetical protein